MKKFIKALEDKGIMKNIIFSGVSSEKITGRPVKQEGLEMILELEMSRDEDLEDIFLQEAHAIAMNSVFKYVKKQIVERQKAEALNDVDFDALFAKATGKEESKDLDAKVESIIMKSLSKALGDMFGVMLSDLMDDSK